ncbi:MAG: hypothetical protein HC786_21590 [Richelia sp. CSU_2_1]|nr:hypothetical protein [Microcoleus sp. SU_5_6]NJL66733.1 hypothetical protein [Microcoleus sp. SM1_3_4]NJR24563.1 hypothetical protein [Richelia sp. CSU_2_1]
MRKALLNSLQIFNKKPTIQWGDGDGKMGRVGEWGKRERRRGGEWRSSLQQDFEEDLPRSRLTAG